MNFTLAPFASMAPSQIPDLRETLEARRASQLDVEARTSDLEFTGGAYSIRLRVSGKEHPVRPAALDDFARRSRLSSSESIRRDFLNDALRSRREALVRLESGAVRAILPAETRLVGNLELLDTVVPALRRTGTEIKIEHCREDDGELYLTALAPGLAAEAGVGDHLYGGFLLANSETAVLDTEACARIFRLACSNGALSDFGEGRRLVLPRFVPKGEPDPYSDWPRRLGEVVAQSFNGGTFDEDARRFRATMDQMLATPYEFLLNLSSQGLITGEEHERIQKEFRETDDTTLYGLINAITRIAHGWRDGDDPRRASDLERLAGEIIRGDHQPPVLEPSYR